MAQMITPFGLQAQGNDKDKENEFRQRVKMALTQMDAETAAGYALGSFMRDAWMNHLAKRHAKNDLKEKQAEEARKRHDANVAAGYDLESWAKDAGIGSIGGYEGNVPHPQTAIGGDAATSTTAPNYDTGKWNELVGLGGYSRNSGVPGNPGDYSFDIVQETLKPYKDPREDLFGYKLGW